MRPVRKADNLPPSCAVVTKYGNVNFVETSGPLRACNGTLHYSGTFTFVTVTSNIYIYIWHIAFGYLSYLSDHLPKVEVVIIPPNNTSSVQPMHTAVTANIKAHYLRTNFVACCGGYGMSCNLRVQNLENL